jgi:hypothetical protein
MEIMIMATKLTLAELKRRLTIGAKIRMIRHSWGKDGLPAEKFAGVREVIKVQTNAVQFAGGSWLDWPPAASVRGTDNGFEIDLRGTTKFEEVVAYEFRS